MAYYDALIAKWATLTGATAEKLAAINALTVAGPTVTVSRGDIRQHFDNMVDANGAPVWEDIEAHKGDTSALGVACRAALRLRDAPGDYPPVDVNAVMFQQQLAALVTGTVLTQAQSDSTTALGATQIPWWQSAGYSSPINGNDLVAAGGLT